MAAATQLDEESLILGKVAALQLPAGVKFRRIEQISDWTGEPALRIYFSVSKKRPTTPKHIKELSAMSVQLEESVLSLRLGKFPFVKFEEVR